MKSGKKTGVMLVFFVIGIGLWLALWAAAEVRDWLDSDTWAATESTSLTIQPKTSQVMYTYQVGGREYTGQRTHFFVSTPYQDDRHLTWLNEHRQASVVTVYYDPDAPGQAVLVRQVDLTVGINAGLVAGAVCLSCGLPLIVVGGLWWWMRSQFSDFVVCYIIEIRRFQNSSRGLRTPRPPRLRTRV
jgi:hypothetical protein